MRIGAKNALKWPGYPDHHIGWATSMPFTSFYFQISHGFEKNPMYAHFICYVFAFDASFSAIAATKRLRTKLFYAYATLSVRNCVVLASLTSSLCSWLHSNNGPFNGSSINGVVSREFKEGPTNCLIYTYTPFTKKYIKLRVGSKLAYLWRSSLWTNP